MSWVVSVADAGCMTIGVSVASEKQPHACSLDEDGRLAVRPLTARPPVTTLRRLVPLLGQRSRDKRSEGRGCALTFTQHAFLSVTSGHRQPAAPPPASVPRNYGYHSEGGDGPVRLLLPPVSTFTPQQSQLPPHTLPAQCQCPPV